MFHRLTELRDKRERGEGGFTLIELLVVVVIIGILIAIAIPLYLNYRRGANDKSSQSDLRGAISAMEQCSSDNGIYPSGTVSLAAPCTNQKITTSSGTTLTIWGATDGSGYLAISYNSGGNVSGGTAGYYCYASKTGGSVAKDTATQPTAYGASCP